MTAARCRNLYCTAVGHNHLTPKQIFCCEWVPIPEKGRYELCSRCHSKFEIDGESEKRYVDGA